MEWSVSIHSLCTYTTSWDLTQTWELAGYTVTWKTTPGDDPNGHDARSLPSDTCDHAYLRSCEVVMEAVGFRQLEAHGSLSGKDIPGDHTGEGSGG